MRSLVRSERKPSAWLHDADHPICRAVTTGKGLGVDFRHCMTCNACVSLSISPSQHKCITQVRCWENCSHDREPLPRM